MFFPDRIKNISSGDKVLEVGPGGDAHPRSDVFLEMEFTDENEAKIQRSSSPPLDTDKPIVYYDGTRFPFNDDEFDYVICSHVLEHVPDVELFLNEVQRVAKKGYLEFPTIYYDYLYNTPTHVNILMYRNDKIHYMKKCDTGLDNYQPVQDFFSRTIGLNYDQTLKDLKKFFFQGFEWRKNIFYEKADQISVLTYDMDVLVIEKRNNSAISKLARKIYNKLG